jgi:hypothetical protein
MVLQRARHPHPNYPSKNIGVFHSCFHHTPENNVVFLGEAGKARIDFREIVSYNPLLSFLIKRGVAKIKATSTDSHKETDFEMFHFWRKLFEICGKLRRY